MEIGEFAVIKQNTISRLDDLKIQHPNGFHYWQARDLQKLLGYSDWRNFKDAIQRAKMACESSGGTSSHHFGDITKMVNIGSGTKRDVEDVLLTRYACYLIAMNGDPTKPEIAACQKYFAIQTRKQELAQQHDDLMGRKYILWWLG